MGAGKDVQDLRIFTMFVVRFSYLNADFGVLKFPRKFQKLKKIRFLGSNPIDFSF
ncbi:hypothetical protein Aazo_4274 ['Nostoc azollae' 0708]|jgi:hypothetical protein|uniref:Uncharacterized protein n=1 Tax=Nostoc azollae (strain 0708) TaxID=551115 RepID=D7DW74_NOSA0|nr:hypothetical protein Aazo_4274 ['Nostoc azollae' 0708]